MLQNTKFSNCPGGQCEYGLGIETWNQGGVKGYGKNGTSIGYEANWIYFPGKNTTVITFANKGGGTHKDFMDRVLKWHSSIKKATIQPLTSVFSNSGLIVKTGIEYLYSALAQKWNIRILNTTAS